VPRRVRKGLGDDAHDSKTLSMGAFGNVIVAIMGRSARAL
jgi:hypothetical protein